MEVYVIAIPFTVCSLSQPATYTSELSFLPPAYVAWHEGNVLTHVCQSVCPRGGGGVTYPGQVQGTYLPGQVPMGGGVPQDTFPPPAQGTYPPPKVPTPQPDPDGGRGYPKVPTPLPKVPTLLARYWQGAGGGGNPRYLPPKVPTPPARSG